MLQATYTFLLDNKQWLFDGLGLAVLGGLFALYRWFDKRRERAIRMAAARENAKLLGTSPASRPVPMGGVHVVGAASSRPSDSGILRYCNFCQRSERNVERMVVTAGGNICSVCVREQQARLEHEPQRASLVKDLCELSLKAASPSITQVARDLASNKIHQLASRLRKGQSEGAGDVVCRARLIRVVGAGSFATVWESTPLSEIKSTHSSTLAIKVFRQDMLTQGVMLWRFQRGIRAMRKFADLGNSTPSSIVRFCDVSDDLLSFSMEFLAGGDIHRIKQKNLTLRARLQIFADIAEAIAFAHRHEVIHRDIKPANVLLRPDGRAAITDFDIADLSFAVTQSVSSGALGTAQFAAPEQQTSDIVTAAHPTADIFSLGKLLFFLLNPCLHLAPAAPYG